MPTFVVGYVTYRSAAHFEAEMKRKSDFRLFLEKTADLQKLYTHQGFFSCGHIRASFFLDKDSMLVEFDIFCYEARTTGMVRWSFGIILFLDMYRLYCFSGSTQQAHISWLEKQLTIKIYLRKSFGCNSRASCDPDMHSRIEKTRHWP